MTAEEICTCGDKKSDHVFRQGRRIECRKCTCKLFVPVPVDPYH